MPKTFRWGGMPEPGTAGRGHVSAAWRWHPIGLCTLLLQTAAATVVGQSPDALDTVLADQRRRVDMIAR
ncbi:MAG: hypothetical protein ACE5EX_10570, partial [Phycisphaerae bacterium]